jgi:hypothetical protein
MAGCAGLSYCVKILIYLMNNIRIIMEYSESILVELYTWCFEVSPDTVVGNTASLAGTVGSVSIYEAETSDGSMVWCVSGESGTSTITAFEVDLAVGIDNFKSSWLNRDNPI